MNRIKRYILFFPIAFLNIGISFADISNRGRYSDFAHNSNLDYILIPIIAFVLIAVGILYIYYIVQEKFCQKKKNVTIKTTTPSHDKQIRKQEVVQNRETEIKEILKDPFNSRIHKLYESICIYNDMFHNKCDSLDEYLEICFHMLNLLESRGKLKNKEERYKAAELLLYLRGHGIISELYTKLLTDAKEIKSNSYNPFCISDAGKIYDIYTELLGEPTVKLLTFSPPDPLKMDTIGGNVFKKEYNQ